MRRLLLACLLGLSVSSAAAQDVDYLDMLEVVFVGQPDREVIELSISRMLSRFDLPMNEENLADVGDVMVVLRKETGIPEMDTIRCVTEAAPAYHELGMEWRYVSAFCASMMKANR